MRISGAGHADARGAGDERRQRRMRGERRIDGDGIGVEVEKSPCRGHNAGEVAEMRHPGAQAQSRRWILTHLEPRRPTGHAQVPRE